MDNYKKPSNVVAYMTEILSKLEENNPVAKFLNKKYQEILEKIPEDVKYLSEQYLYLFGMMIEEAENNDEFEQQLFLPYKTWNRLYKYMDNLARPKSEENKDFRPRCAMVDSFTLLSWIKEYYALDDQEDYEKEVNEKIEADRKRKEMDDKLKKQREKAKNNKTKYVSSDKAGIDVIANIETLKDNPSAIKKPEEKTEIKKLKRDCNGQLDFFSMLQE